MVEPLQGPTDPVIHKPGIRSKQKYHLNNHFIDLAGGMGVRSSWTKILDILVQLLRAFLKFETTAVQSSYNVVKTRLRYLNYKTADSGRPYT